MYNVVVFMDRDGVINEDLGYVHKKEDFKFLKSVFPAIRRLNKLKIPIILVTNQSGVERGLYTEDDVKELHCHMMDQLFKYSAKIDAIYFCPSIDSNYRKPNSGMFVKAIEDFGLHDYKKFVIGDKLSDLVAGYKVGCKKILMLTGQGKTEFNNISTMIETPDYVSKNLYDAVKYIEKSI